MKQTTVSANAGNKVRCGAQTYHTLCADYSHGEPSLCAAQLPLTWPYAFILKLTSTHKALQPPNFKPSFKLLA